MSLEKEDAYEVIENQGWEVRDDFETNEEWSISAAKGEDIRISIQNEIDEPTLNNLIVESHPIQISNVEEYEEAAEVAGDELMVQVTDNEGIFHRAKHSVELEDKSDAEILELIFDKDIAVGVQFVAVDASQEVGVDVVPEMVEQVESAMEDADFFEHDG